VILATFAVYTSQLHTQARSLATRKTKTKSETTMAIADLKNVLKIFRGSALSKGQQDELRKEVLLMTLARAADADINIQKVEVDRIQQILNDHTGEKFSTKDIRMAARAELYAEATLRKYLLAVSKKLRSQDRLDIVRALTDVFRSDSDVSVLEIDFFNRTVKALGASPAEIAGLSAGEVE
jgi:uncharacterized tellurite resistance protein B-like protein